MCAEAQIYAISVFVDNVTFSSTTPHNDAPSSEVKTKTGIAPVVQPRFDQVPTVRTALDPDRDEAMLLNDVFCPFIRLNNAPKKLK